MDFVKSVESRRLRLEKIGNDRITSNSFRKTPGAFIKRSSLWMVVNGMHSTFSGRDPNIFYHFRSLPSYPWYLKIKTNMTRQGSVYKLWRHLAVRMTLTTKTQEKDSEKTPWRSRNQPCAQYSHLQCWKIKIELLSHLPCYLSAVPATYGHLYIYM